jgi:ABC-type glycerol-3-phosphate transport system substrate-binding protein
VAGRARQSARCGGGTASGASEVKTIKLVAAEYSKDHTKAFWDQFAKAYKDKTGYTLEVQVVSWDNIDQQSSTMIQNNQAPDILNLNAYASYAKDGLLYSSDEVLPDPVKSDILDTFVKYGTYQGKFYGFPDLSSARAFFYNKKIFQQAGIAAPPGNQNAVKAFYNLYYQPDQINTFIKAEGFLPVTKTGLAAFAGEDKLKVYLATLPNARLTPTDDPTWDKIKLAVQQNLGRAMTGDPKAVLDNLQKTAENGG